METSGYFTEDKVGKHHPYCLETFKFHKENPDKNNKWICMCDLLKQYDKWRHDDNTVPSAYHND